ncbi:apolipoprotein B-100 isoform X1 [Anguilla rostrata]|uniref:apolipoprotein B-100 isoform X1 n=1 Tax=Anguilla rostrata TaxID=7938 RepID=UPI0030CAE977
MGRSKLCLLLLLSTCALAQQPNESGEEQTPACLLAARYKNFKKYVYRYEAEAQNGVSGTAGLKNGPKVTCKVELEVPQACVFVLRTEECALSEVSAIDAEGRPEHQPAYGTNVFRAAMEKNPLKFAVTQDFDVNLLPELDEPANILNVKRGIVSALMVPVSEEDGKANMPTIHGQCRTALTVSPGKDITISRDLTACKSFNPMSDYASPLVLVSRMNAPLSNLISSTQSCTYQFDNKRKHMTEASCTEKHIFLPFSHQKEHGITSLVKQTLSLQDSSRITNRNVDFDWGNMRPLEMQYAEDKAPTQSKEAMLATLRDLKGLSQTERGQERAALFHKLVSQLRGLNNETLGPAVEEMMEASEVLTWQALPQCGTPECLSAVLQVLRTFDGAALEADAVVYAVGLLPRPDGSRVRDMLSTAQNRQNKAVMYGLSNSVRKFYEWNGYSPELTEVSEFMASLLDGDCSGDEDRTFLTLRVIGNMGAAMDAADTTLKSVILSCARQPAASASVQLAAIQALRQMSIDGEGSYVLAQVFQDAGSPVQKRIAAYLMMMKNMELAIPHVVDALRGEQDEQVRSFVVSHISNILKSGDAESEDQKMKLQDALENQAGPQFLDMFKLSHNYKMETPSRIPIQTSMESNMIFDSTGYMPRELMLDTTLKAFGYNYDMFEVGLEGKGLEPTIEALFGKDGFFPDTASKAMYWVGDKMPDGMHDVLKNWIGPLRNERLKRQVSEDLVREISQNFNKLLQDLQAQAAPEALAYLRIMGTELGYIKTSEIEQIAYVVAMYGEILFKLMPAHYVKSLLSGTDNDLFAHYIFMDNEFALPTAAGLPLQFSLSGIFSGGAKGGCSFAPGKKALSFMPSLGVELVTKMGVNLPEFVTAGVEMHTSAYHESGLNAKVTVEGHGFKLSIPAPQGSTQLFSISNRLLSVSSTQTEVVPPLVEGRTDSVECDPLFAGLKLCTITQYSNASSIETAPYYPLTGESRFAVELQPTGEVTEYTATVAYAVLKEGKEGRQKVDTVQLTLRAEGTSPTEATATLKYDRKRSVFSADVQIPDHDVEVGLKLTATDSTLKGKNTRALTFDVTNKNIPQLSLVGRARMDAMKEGMLQIQLTVPSLNVDVATTATMKNANGLTLQLETSANVPETSSVQKVIFRYDENRVEVEVKSDLSSEITKLLPETEVYQRRLQKVIDEILDQRVAKTDMKVRHIVSKAFEAVNIWLDKVSGENPKSKRSIPELTLPSLPEKLFLKYDGLFRYQFNKNKLTLTIPLPLGGKTSEDLNIPASITIPEIYQGDGPSITFTVPSFTIPREFELSLPLIGVAEVSAKVNSNFYNWEGSVSGGNDTIDVPSFIGKYKVAAESPINIFSYKVEGTGMIVGSKPDTLKYLVNGSLSHSLIDASFSIMETTNWQDQLSARSNSKIEVSSPLGLQMSLYSSAQSQSGPEQSTGEFNLDGAFRARSLYANFNYTFSNVLSINEPLRGESTLKIDSSLLRAQNRINGVYGDGGLSVTSNTNLNDDALKQVAELTLKDAKLSLTCNTVGKIFRNKVDLSISRESATIRVQSDAETGETLGTSLISGTLDAIGLEIDSDGSVKLETGYGSHKATLRVNKDGVATSGTTTLQCNPLTFENVFDGSIDFTGALLSLSTKGSLLGNSADLKVDAKIGHEEAYVNSVYNGNLLEMSSRGTTNLKANKQGLTFSNNLMGSVQNMRSEHTHTLTATLWTLAFQSKTDNYICDHTSYKHDIKVNLIPFIATVSATNDLKLLDVEFKNDGLLKLEPSKLHLKGSLRGAYEEDKELTHTYEINYADLVGSMKCVTSGKLLGAQMSHNSDFEFAGLSSKYSSEVRFNSKSFRLDGSFRTLAVPLSLSVDGVLNSDGELDLYGKLTGQLYSRFLLKAQPLAVAYSHNCRASTTHRLDSGGSAETHVDNKIEGLLSPQEQSTKWTLKSKLNSHVYNQEVSAFNQPERIGLEFSGTLLTDLLNKAAGGDPEVSEQNQEFSLSGFLKYDKNGDSLIIQMPFVESIPALFEKVKGKILSAFESLQEYINSADINQLVGEFMLNLDKLPMQVGEYMDNVNLENKFNEAKRQMIDLMQGYAITLDDLENSVENMKTAFEEALNVLLTRIRDLAVLIKDKIESGAWTDAITDILNRIGHELQAFDERYDISKTIVNGINAIEDIITQVDFQKLTDNSVAWLQELDTKFKIKEKLQEKIRELKQVIESFDILMFIHDLRDYITSINVVEHLDKLANIPTDEIARVIDSMKDVIVNWIEEYEVADKINAVIFKVKELIKKYDMGKKLEALMDQASQLIKQYKLQETVQSVVNIVKSIDFQSLSDKFMQMLEDAINSLKAIDFKQMLDDLNDYIAKIVQQIREFDYNAFVDETNQKISEMIQYVNEQIEANEIPQKIEASREFLRSILETMNNYLEQLKNTKVAEMLKIIKDVIDTTALNDIKTKIQESLEDMRQRISDMDIRNEISLHLERARDSYMNMISYIASQINNLILEIERLLGDQEILKKIGEVAEGVLNALKTAEFTIPSITVPFTDLVIPSIPIQMNSIHEIAIPPQVTLPEFTILSKYTVPSITIDFEELKQRIIAFIESIKDIEIPMPEPEAIFGDLRVLYMSFQLPDLTFPEITLKEIKLPEIHIPKLNLENFSVTMLPLPELKLPEIPGEFMVPAFGKLYGEFRINSPHYNLLTTAMLQNSTGSPRTPQFTASLTSEAKSTLEYLEYTLDASASLTAKQMKSLVLSEAIKFNHVVFSLDHQGTVTLSGPSAQVTAKTVAKATTEIYAVDISNNVQIALESGISATSETTYKHDLNIPSIDVLCQATATQKAVMRLESGTISMIVGTTGSGKWSIQDYSDDGTYKSDLDFTINFNTAKLTFSGEADSKTVKMKHDVKVQSVVFSYVNFEAYAEAETPFIKRSVMTLNGKGIFEDLKIELTASHDTEFVGRVTGTLSNAINFLAHPFEVVVDCKNKGNLRVIFPLKLTGKIDLQNDFGVTVNSGGQNANWVVLARFNQYKYFHNFKVDNNKQNTGIYAAINGEANLDFLTVPLTIPEMDVPYTDMKTPTIQEFSLWEDTGLKNLLSTTRQSFDMDFKLVYLKNPDSHTIGFDLEPIYGAINENAKVLSANFELARDKAFSLLTESYNHAKAQFEKFRIDTTNQPPRIFTIPGYTVPILDIEVSPFTAELPAFSFLIPKEVSTPSFRVPMMGFSVPSYTLVLPAMTLPVLHVPETLRDLTLPTFTLPTMQNTIMIPAMGNMTYDFSLKCSVITLNINAGVFNHSDIVARFAASSTSEFDILKGKLDATTSLTKKRGLKLATAISIDHKNIEGTHDSTISLARTSIEASVATTAKLKLPVLHLDFNQELLGNTKTKPNVASKLKLKYSFDLPLIDVTGKGNIEQNLALEGLSSYISLETSTKGNIDGTVKAHVNFAGAVDNEATVYLNANGLRSTIKTDTTSKLDYKKANVWDLVMNTNQAIEASLRRVYMTLSYTSNNMAAMGFFDTKGTHTAKATLEFIPLTTLTTKVEIAVSQPSSIGDAGMDQTIDLEITTDKQKFTWSGKEQVTSITHIGNLVLSNDETEVRMELTDTVKGNVAFLKTVKLPVYQKTIWDVLKFDEVMAEDQLQSLTLSTVVVYTKNMEGLYFTLPTKIFENGVTFSFPEISLAVPSWVQDIPLSIRDIDMRFENIRFPDEFSVPPAISIPSFEVPFTNLQVPSYTLDLKNLEVPKVISTPGFDVELPGLPKVEVPSINIDTEYIAQKMSSLLLKIPRYEITVPSFSLPKSFTVGDHNLDLDEIANHISNFEMPTITIPQQRIDVPEVSLYLPTGVFIPYFGALSTTVKVQSPIYSNSWDVKLENKDSALVSSLKSSCTSTIKLLEYSLEATATTRLEDGTLNLIGTSLFTHSDLKVDWQHVFAHNMRAKRQASSDDSSRHTLSVDIISPTFIDANFRYTSRKDGLSASLSSPSAGFVGLLLQKRSPSQVYAKLFARYASAPDKDVEILSFKATLRNSEKLALQTGWNLQAQVDMFTELKERVPAITSALLKFANKHHTAQFGMDLNRASLKLKNTLSNTIERAYHEIPRSLDTLQANLEKMKDQGKAVYKRATNNMFIDLQEMVGRLADDTRDLLRQYQKNVKIMLDAVIKFLSDTKFQLPGFQDKLTGQELYQRASSSVVMAVDQAVQKIADILESYPESLLDYVERIEFTVPGLELEVSGSRILDWVKSFMRDVQNWVVDWARNAKNVRLEQILRKLSDLLQSLIQKAEQLVASLKLQDLGELSARLNDVYGELRKPLHGVFARLEAARESTAEYKDLAKMKIQEVYNQVTLERVNTDLQRSIETIIGHTNNVNTELIDFLQRASKSAQPYVRVSNKKMDIDIPLPFFWKSFSEWPTQTRY